MTDAFICDALRTPFGRYGGALSAVRADDLGAIPMRALLARHPENTTYQLILQRSAMKLFEVLRKKRTSC